MGWHIDEVENTLELTDECIKDLLVNSDKFYHNNWENEEEFVWKDDDGKKFFWFNYDHMEHMDYMWDEEIIKILKKHKLKGDVCFASNDGDNAGSMWGYRYDGNGNFVNLVAEVTWVESKEENE